MAKCKRSAARALDWLVAEGAEVVAVVASEPDAFTRDEQRVDLVAERHGLPLVSDEELYADAARGRGRRDLVPVLEADPRAARSRSAGSAASTSTPRRCPDMRGLGGYNVAVLEGMSEWGVSCHFVDAELRHRRPRRGGALPDRPGHRHRASRSTWRARSACSGSSSASCGRALAGEELPRTPQGAGPLRGRARSSRRCAACGRATTSIASCAPSGTRPIPGALIEVDGRDLTLVDERLLAEVAQAYRDAGSGALTSTHDLRRPAEPRIRPARASA